MKPRDTCISLHDISLLNSLPHYYVEQLVTTTHLQRPRVELRVLVHVLQQPPRSADDDVAPAQPTALELEVLPADDEAGAEVVVPAHGAHLVEDLVGQLAGGGDHQGAEAGLLGPSEKEILD